MATKKEELRAMMNSDLENLLIQVGDYDTFLEGKLCCSSCGTVLNADNVALVLPVQNGDSIKLKYCCDNVECMKNF